MQARLTTAAKRLIQGAARHSDDSSVTRYARGPRTINVHNADQAHSRVIHVVRPHILHVQKNIAALRHQVDDHHFTLLKALVIADQIKPGGRHETTSALLGGAIILPVTLLLCELAVEIVRAASFRRER